MVDLAASPDGAGWRPPATTGRCGSPMSPLARPVSSIARRSTSPVVCASRRTPDGWPGLRPVRSATRRAFDRSSWPRSPVGRCMKRRRCDSTIESRSLPLTGATWPSCRCGPSTRSTTSCASTCRFQPPPVPICCASRRRRPVRCHRSRAGRELPWDSPDRPTPTRRQARRRELQADASRRRRRSPRSSPRARDPAGRAPRRRRPSGRPACGRRRAGMAVAAGGGELGEDRVEPFGDPVKGRLERFDFATGRVETLAEAGRRGAGFAATDARSSSARTPR